LATKAGLLAVVLVSATVAGGLAVVGYNVLNPSPAVPGDNLQLFASKPKDTTPEVAPVPEDGASKSLSFLNEANRDPGTPEAPQTAAAIAASQDATAASAASDNAAGTGAANVAAAGSGGNGVSTLLKGDRFGQLSTLGAGTGGAAKGGAGAAGDAAAVAAAAHAGKLSAMKGVANANGARSIAGRKFGSRGALGQAFGAMRDNRTATSSAGGGVTYDGSNAAGSNIGANGSAIGGPGDGAGPAQAKSITNPAAVDPQLAPPPTPNATPMAPWQNAIKTAQMLIGVSVALMLIAKLAAKTQYGKIIA